ncbi:MAG: type II toxin-antitoxin system HicB family antitoxin [Spirochaetales bacterium]|jgi:antitoxin HicB|nr:type II toxin-antitoxin system HicB family antitoxin [Spirochaetales bacterium]
MKSLEDYLKLPYTIETKRESDGSYFIKVKELPGCMSIGESIEEAYAMIEDAMAEWIQFNLDAGRVIPEPEEYETKTYSGKFVVRISSRLHQELSDAAEENGVSLNHLVSEMLSQGSGIVKTQRKVLEHLLYRVFPPPLVLSEEKVPMEMETKAPKWTPLKEHLKLYVNSEEIPNKEVVL